MGTSEADIPSKHDEQGAGLSAAGDRRNENVLDPGSRSAGCLSAPSNLISMKQVMATTAALAVLMLNLATEATAHDHRMPRVVLHADEQTRSGYLVESWWTRAASDGSGDCIGGGGHGWGWPRGLRYEESTHEATIRMKKATRPMELFFTAGIGRASNGEPATALMPWPFTLRPVPNPLQPRAWDIVFPLPPDKHVFFELEASWADEDGCGGFPDLGSQYGVWRFHLRN